MLPSSLGACGSRFMCVVKRQPARAPKICLHPAVKHASRQTTLVSSGQYEPVAYKRMKHSILKYDQSQVLGLFKLTVCSVCCHCGMCCSMPWWKREAAANIQFFPLGHCSRSIRPLSLMGKHHATTKKPTCQAFLGSTICTTSKPSLHVPV